MKHTCYITATLMLTLCSFTFVAPPKIKILMVGDSTMANKKAERYPEMGWGQVLGNYFTEDVSISNHAANGRSTKSFINEQRWQKVMDELAAGNYVFIQFGHNDEKVDKPAIGTTLAEFEVNLTKLVEEVKAKKGIPVLFTPVVRRVFTEGKIVDTHGEYPAIVKKVAQKEQIAFIDLLQKSISLLTKEGQQESKKLFLIADSGKLTNYPKGISDNTHFSEQGANEMAKLVIEGIKEIKLPLAAYLKK